MIAAWLPTNCDKRRHHDRIAELDAHAARLLERLLELCLLADLAELVAEIGDHAARHLVLVGFVVVLGRHAEREALALGDNVEVLADRTQHLLVDHRLVAERAQIVRDVEDRGQRRTVGERRHAGVHDPDAEPHRFERNQRAEAGRAMAVQLDRNAARVLEHDWHKRAHALGREQPARVLEAEPERLERYRLAAALRIIVVGVNRRDRIDQVDDWIEPELARDLRPDSSSPAGRSRARRCAPALCRSPPCGR